MATAKPIIASLVGVTPVALYTWSAGVAELESVDILNRLTTTVLVDLYLDNNGTAVYLTKARSLNAGESLAYRGAVPANSTGQVFKIVSDTAASLDALGRVTEF